MIHTKHAVVSDMQPLLSAMLSDEQTDMVHSSMMRWYTTGVRPPSWPEIKNARFAAEATVMGHAWPERSYPITQHVGHSY